MPVVLKYTKAQYQAKISELENYLAQLKDHRQKMAELKERMFNFWDDPNARKAGEALAVQIRQVDNSMMRTNDMLRFYQQSVEKLGGTDSAVGGLLEDAISILGSLGV